MDYVYMASHTDDFIVALPAVIPGALAIGFALVIAESQNSVISSLGHIGARVFGVLTAVAGLPLVVWNLVKIIFANLLNIVTFGAVRPCVKFARWMNSEAGSVLKVWSLVVGQPDLIKVVGR